MPVKTHTASSESGTGQLSSGVVVNLSSGADIIFGKSCIGGRGMGYMYMLKKIVFIGFERGRCLC